MSPAEVRGAYFSSVDDRAFEGFTFVNESAAHLVSQVLAGGRGSNSSSSITSAAAAAGGGASSSASSTAGRVHPGHGHGHNHGHPRGKK